MNITTKTRTSIRESLFAKNGHEITHGAKEKSLNSIKEIIQNKVQSCRTPDEKNAVINSVKLAVKTIQENINYKGKNYFTNKTYYGEIDRDFFEVLVGGGLKSQLEEVCVHRNSILGDRKLSFWGTNYTSSANELRSWADNQYPTRSLQKSRFIEKRSDIKFPQQSAVVKLIESKKADVLKRLNHGEGEFKINGLDIDKDAPKPNNFGNIPEKFQKLIYDKQNTATAGVLVQDIHGQVVLDNKMINIKPDVNNLIKVDQSRNNFTCQVSYSINIADLEEGTFEKIGDMIYKYTVNEDVFTTKQAINTEINFVFQNRKEIKIQFLQKSSI